MRRKHFIVIGLVLLIFIALVIAFLFQIGADKRVIEAMLPGVEKRLNVRIHYDEIDTSLTSVVIKKIVIQPPSEDILLATIDKLAVSFRIGPLFWGGLDITGIRVDNLHLQSGNRPGVARPADWLALIQNLKGKSPAGNPQKRKTRMPEIYLASGSIEFQDEHITASAEGLTGSIGPNMESVFKVESYFVKHNDRTLVSGNNAHIRYVAVEKRVSIQAENPLLELPADRAVLSSLVRDGTSSLSLFSEYSRAARSDGATGTRSATGPAFRQWEGMITNGTGAIVDPDNPANRFTVKNITVNVSPMDKETVVVSASGQSPGSASPITIEAQIPSSGDSTLAIAFPGVSLGDLGPVLVPSKHITWTGSSVRGKLEIGFGNPGENISLSGQTELSNIAFQHDRLAAEPITGFSISTDFAMVYKRSEAVLHIENLLFSRGMTRTVITGNLWPDRLAFDLSLHVPPTACNQIKGALPDALKPRLDGVTLSGQLALDLRLALDEQLPEEVALEVDLDNRCRITKFGTVPKPDFFRAPFAYPAYTEKGDVIRLVTGPGTDRWTPVHQISPYVIESLLTTEDGKFWKHNGVTIPEARRAVSRNLKKRAFQHGASTITMQLAKNLFLTRNRNISRKLQELFFVWYLESNFSKDEILELYLNIVEFGPSIYGITDAAMYYFGRDPPELNQIESVYLIRLLPNPVKRHDKTYARNTVSQRQMNTYHRVLRTMNARKRITDFELAEGLHQKLEFHIGDAPLPIPRPPVRRYGAGNAPAMGDYDPVDDVDMDDAFW